MKKAGGGCWVGGGLAPRGPAFLVPEFRPPPLPVCLGRKIPAEPRLRVPLQLVERNSHAFSVCLPYPVIAAYKGRKRYALGRRKRRVPSCAVFHRAYLVAAPVHVFSGCLDRKSTRL